MTASQSEQTYDELLEELVSLCEELTRDGMPYVSVLLMHEFNRYLYPIEPYAGFENKDPVSFILPHIRRLIGLGRVLQTSVTPYQGESGGLGTEAWRAGVLEKATSNLYSELWKEFKSETLTDEGPALLGKRIPESIIATRIKGKKVLDMGCGSGRYTLGLAMVGAAEVAGIDFQAKAFQASAVIAKERKLPIEFREANVHELPFADQSFDYVFCNGVLHHSSSIAKGLSELKRVLRKDGEAFLYLYAARGFFWKARVAMRRVFVHIPLDYTKAVLQMIGMPPNRFIFCDNWYVPVETHTTLEEMVALLDQAGFRYEKLVGQAPFDLDKAIADGVKDAVTVWGDGEHRYRLWPLG